MSWVWQSLGSMGAAGGNQSVVQGRDFRPYSPSTAWYVTDPTRVTVDQTGNGYNVVISTAPTNISGPDLGYVASRSGRYNYSGANVGDFRIAGAISCVALVSRNGMVGDSWAAACERTGAPFPTWWKFGLQDNLGTFRLVYSCDNGVASAFTPIGGSVPAIGYHTVGWTRRSDGVTIDGYLNGVLVNTVTAAFAAAGSGSSTFWTGQDAFGVPNVNAWQVIGVRLGGWSAAEMAVIAKRLNGT